MLFHGPTDRLFFSDIYLAPGMMFSLIMDTQDISQS